jgi:quinol monooxygenase YgiN
MTVLIHAEIHGLVGRASELRDVLRDHAEQLARAEGSLGAAAYEPLGGGPGEFVVDAWWRDEAALRAHYATAEYAHYVQLVGELLARPGDATVHTIERSYRPGRGPLVGSDAAGLAARPPRTGQPWGSHSHSPRRASCSPPSWSSFACSRGATSRTDRRRSRGAPDG